MANFKQDQNQAQKPQVKQNQQNPSTQQRSNLPSENIDQGRARQGAADDVEDTESESDMGRRSSGRAAQ